MSSFKKFIEKIIFVTPEEEKKQLEKQQQQENIVKKPEEKPVAPAVNRPANNTVREVRKPVSEPVSAQEKPKAPTFINLTPEQPKPATQPAEEIREEKPAAPAAAPTVAPAATPVVNKEPAKKETNGYVYKQSQVISPLFGVQKKEEPVKNKKKKVEHVKLPTPEQLQQEKKSVLGTVFSPVYGDKDSNSEIPADEVAPEVASLSVEDMLQVTAKLKQVKKEETVEPIKETVSETVRETVEIIAPEKKQEPVKTVNSALPNISVTPFGAKASEVNNVVVKPAEEVVVDPNDNSILGIQMSLFDVEEDD